jgi:hypothetical protein
MHIAMGAKGDHVLRIQQALTVLGEVPYTLWIHFASEANAKHYGTATASTVLRYKTKRHIVNYLHERYADDIVGKMTIARLDLDMIEYERTHMF